MRIRIDGIDRDARHVAPVGVARGHEVGLAAQDHAVVEHLEAVGVERGAGGGDVDDHLGSSDRRRAFRGAGAFDDAVVDDAVRSKKTAGQVDVLGGEEEGLREQSLPEVLGQDCVRKRLATSHGSRKA